MLLHHAEAFISACVSKVVEFELCLNSNRFCLVLEKEKEIENPNPKQLNPGPALFSSPLLAQQTPAAHSSPLPFPQPSTLFPAAARAGPHTPAPLTAPQAHPPEPQPVRSAQPLSRDRVSPFPLPARPHAPGPSSSSGSRSRNCRPNISPGITPRPHGTPPRDPRPCPS